MNFAFVAGVVVLLNTVNLSLQAPGSTPNIKEEVLKKCKDFQNKKLGPDKLKWKDCNKIWEAFRLGFAYKNPCKLTPNDYKPFFTETGMDVIQNKIMFWSGTYKIAHDYSKDRFITLEDTFPGYLVNGLTFCGNENLPLTSDGIDYESCPDRSKDCDYPAAFWGLASKTFAEQARGIARIMLSGSRVDKNGKPRPAYDRSSYFSRYELPNLPVPKITGLKIFVIHDINEPKSMANERCGKGSIALLQTDIEQREIKYICKDAPADLEKIFCVDFPTAPECLKARL